MKDDVNIWTKTHRERRSKRQGFNRVVWWHAILYGSYLLVAVACWSVIAIYGPVLVAEVNFQLKKINVFKPVSFELVPSVLATGYSIVIPKIYLAEPVVINVDPNDKLIYREALNRGIALAAGTSLPGDGGLGYYFAHSSGMNVLAPQKQATFYLLGKLEVGDEVDIYRDKVKYRYQVINKLVTSPTDISFLQQTSDKELIVLQTCWPVGTSLQRLLITAEKING